VDDDWLLGVPRAWPVDQCVVSSISSSLIYGFSYYQCVDAQTVYKYRWDNVIFAERDDYTEDCLANYIDDATITEYTYSQAQNDSDSSSTCNDVYWFNCEGDDDYFSTDVVLDTGCGDTATVYMIAKAATNVCQCTGNATVPGSMLSDPTKTKNY
jgi:hypothetical protein